MDRIRIIALSLGLLLALSACGAGSASSPYLGTWYTTEASFDGRALDVENDLMGGLTIELQDQGLCQLTFAGKTDELTWSEEDGSITLSDGQEDLVGTIDEESMNIEMEGALFTLVRENEEG